MSKDNNEVKVDLQITESGNSDGALIDSAVGVGLIGEAAEYTGEALEYAINQLKKLNSELQKALKSNSKEDNGNLKFDILNKFSDIFSHLPKNAAESDEVRKICEILSSSFAKGKPVEIKEDKKIDTSVKELTETMQKNVEKGIQEDLGEIVNTAVQKETKRIEQSNKNNSYVNKNKIINDSNPKNRTYANYNWKDMNIDIALNKLYKERAEEIPTDSYVKQKQQEIENKKHRINTIKGQLSTKGNSEDISKLEEEANRLDNEIRSELEELCEIKKRREENLKAITQLEKERLDLYKNAESQYKRDIAKKHSGNKNLSRGVNEEQLKKEEEFATKLSLKNEFIRKTKVEYPTRKKYEYIEKKIDEKTGEEIEESKTKYLKYIAKKTFDDSAKNVIEFIEAIHSALKEFDKYSKSAKSLGLPAPNKTKEEFKNQLLYNGLDIKKLKEDVFKGGMLAKTYFNTLINPERIENIKLLSEKMKVKREGLLNKGESINFREKDTLQVANSNIENETESLTNIYKDLKNEVLESYKSFKEISDKLSEEKGQVLTYPTVEEYKNNYLSKKNYTNEDLTNLKNELNSKTEEKRNELNELKSEKDNSKEEDVRISKLEKGISDCDKVLEGILEKIKIKDSNKQSQSQPQPKPQPKLQNFPSAPIKFDSNNNLIVKKNKQDVFNYLKDFNNVNDLLSQSLLAGKKYDETIKEITEKLAKTFKDADNLINLVKNSESSSWAVDFSRKKQSEPTYDKMREQTLQDLMYRNESKAQKLSGEAYRHKATELTGYIKDNPNFDKTQQNDWLKRLQDLTKYQEVLAEVNSLEATLKNNGSFIKNGTSAESLKIDIKKLERIIADNKLQGIDISKIQTKADYLKVKDDVDVQVRNQRFEKDKRNLSYDIGIDKFLTSNLRTDLLSKITTVSTKTELSEIKESFKSMVQVAKDLKFEKDKAIKNDENKRKFTGQKDDLMYKIAKDKFLNNNLKGDLLTDVINATTKEMLKTIENSFKGAVDNAKTLRADIDKAKKSDKAKRQFERQKDNLMYDIGINKELDVYRKGDLIDKALNAGTKETLDEVKDVFKAMVKETKDLRADIDKAKKSDKAKELQERRDFKFKNNVKDAYNKANILGINLNSLGYNSTKDIKTQLDLDKVLRKIKEKSEQIGYGDKRIRDSFLLNSLKQFSQRYENTSGLKGLFINGFAKYGAGGKYGHIGGIQKANGDWVGGFNILPGVIGVALTALSKLCSGIVNLGKKSLQVFGEIESLKTNLGVVYGNKSQSNEMFEEISEYALKSPFGIKQITEFAILLKQSGIENYKLLDTLKMIGDIAGGNQEKYQRIANNYAQIIAANRATSLDLRQFANAGLPIYQEIRKELGISQKEVRKMTEEGKIGADIIEKVFKNMTSQNGSFYQAVNKGAQTYKARIQNLDDRKELMYSAIGESWWNMTPKSVDTPSTNYQGLLKSMLDTLENIYGWIEHKLDIGNNAEKILRFRNLAEFIYLLDKGTTNHKKYNENVINSYQKYDKENGTNLAERYKNYPSVKKFIILDKLMKELKNNYSSNYSLDELTGLEFKNYNERYLEAQQQIIEYQKLEAARNVYKSLRTKSRTKDEDLLYKNILTQYSEGDLSSNTNKYYKSMIDAYHQIDVLNGSETGRGYRYVLANNFTKNAIESNQSNQKLSSSATSLTDKFNELYRSTDEYKKAQEKEKELLINNIKNAQDFEKKYNKDLNKIDFIYNYSEEKKFNLNAADKKLLQDKFINFVVADDKPLYFAKQEQDFDKDSFKETISSIMKNISTVNTIYNTDLFNNNQSKEIYENFIKKIAEKINGGSVVYNNGIFDVNQALKNVQLNKNQLTSDDAIALTQIVSDFSNEIKSVNDTFDLAVLNSLVTNNKYVSTLGLNTDALNNVGKEKDYTIFWKRIFSETMGIPLEVLKESDNDPDFKNGMKRAMNLYEKSFIRNQNKALTQSLLKSGSSIRDLTKTLVYSPGMGQGLLGKDGRPVAAIDQAKTNEKLRQLAMSSTSTVVNALADTYDEKLSQIQNLYAEGAFKIEDGKLVTDEEAAKKLNYKKGDLDAWIQYINGLSYLNGSDESYKALITRLEENTKALALSTREYANTKSFLEEQQKDIRKIREGLSLLNISSRNSRGTRFERLSREGQKNFYEKWQSKALSKDIPGNEKTILNVILDNWKEVTERLDDEFYKGSLKKYSNEVDDEYYGLNRFENLWGDILEKSGLSLTDDKGKVVNKELANIIREIFIDISKSLDNELQIETKGLGLKFYQGFDEIATKINARETKVLNDIKTGEDSLVNTRIFNDKRHKEILEEAAIYSNTKYNKLTKSTYKEIEKEEKHNETEGLRTQEIQALNKKYLLEETEAKKENNRLRIEQENLLKDIEHLKDIKKNSKKGTQDWTYANLFLPIAETDLSLNKQALNDSDKTLKDIASRKQKELDKTNEQFDNLINAQDKYFDGLINGFMTLADIADEDLKEKEKLMRQRRQEIIDEEYGKYLDENNVAVGHGLTDVILASSDVNVYKEIGSRVLDTLTGGLLGNTDLEGNTLTTYGNNTNKEQRALNWFAKNGFEGADKMAMNGKNGFAESLIQGLDDDGNIKAENLPESFKNLVLATEGEEGLNSFLDRLNSSKNDADELRNTFADMAESIGLSGESMDYLGQKSKELKDAIGQAFKRNVLNGVNQSFVQIGQNLKNGESATKGMYKIWKNVGKEILGTIGATMTSTGLEIAAEGARTGNKAHIYGGLALAAAGGVASIVSGLLSDSDDNSDKNSGEEQRIQNLKDALADLIDQAKTDAEYYEANLRHKKALASIDTVQTRSVNDAIITPNGNVVTTHPDDYLIATKTPDSLLGVKGGSTSLTINHIVNNMAGNVKVDQEERQNDDGSVDIITTIIDVVNGALGDGKLDAGMAAYQYNQKGKSVAM